MIGTCPRISNFKSCVSDMYFSPVVVFIGDKLYLKCVVLVRHS